MLWMQKIDSLEAYQVKIGYGYKNSFQSYELSNY